MQRHLDNAEDRAALSGPGLRAFFAIAEYWDLNDEDGRCVLGIPDAEIYSVWKNGDGAALDRITLGRETLERISHALGIYKALGMLFPDEKAADGWVKKPNMALHFRRRPALDRMRVDGFDGPDGLMRVRRYLDAQCDGGSVIYEGDDYEGDDADGENVPPEVLMAE